MRLLTVTTRSLAISFCIVQFSIFTLKALLAVLEDRYVDAFACGVLMTISVIATISIWKSVE